MNIINQNKIQFNLREDILFLQLVLITTMITPYNLINLFKYKNN